MFNVGPMELMVLAIVGIVVIGPEKLPGFAKQAAQMLRTLRDLATGARQQLRDELGPEFADVDLRNLNPRTAVQRAVFGDEFDGLSPRNGVRKALFGDDDSDSVDPRAAFRDARDSYLKDEDDDVPHVNGSGDTPVSFTKPVSRPDVGAAPSRPRPRPRPSYGDDVT